MNSIKVFVVSIFVFVGSFALSVQLRPMSTAESIQIDIHSENFQNGDLIFQNSLSDQSAAIEEVQKNPWTHVGVLYKKNGKWFVYEAIGPVILTPLKSFIRSGKNKIYIVKRMASNIVDLRDARLQSKLFAELTKYRGIKYDLFFQWSNERIYCSELVYKAFNDALGVKVGPLVQIKDLDLSGPLAKELVKAREKLLGGPANLEENIVTPGAQHDDLQLVTVN